MRGLELIGRAASGLLLVVLATSSPGCVLLRDDAVRETPQPTEVAESEPPEVQTAAQPAEPSTKPVAAPAKPAPDEPAAPAKPPADRSAEAEDVPEIDQVSVVAPEAPEPRLLQTDEKKVSASSLRDEFGEAERLSAELSERLLTPEQLAQVESGRGFLDSAREALELQDLERAAVLLEKCLVLLRDAEANSRT